MAGASQDWLDKDFYQELGVKKDATQEDIKKAYRKLSRRYHPDRNGGSKDAEEKFKRVGEAYQVLSNPEDRKQYDAIRALGAGGPRFRAGGQGSGGFEDIFSMFSGGRGGTYHTSSSTGGARGGSFGGNFEDVLGGLFGGGQGGGGFSGFGSQRRPQKGADMTATVSLPLRQAVDGATVKIQTASGKSVTAKVPAGVSDGQKIRIAGKGHPGLNGGPAGDIIVTVHVEAHPVFEVQGKDVYVNVPISFPEAALGATVEVPTLAGKTVRVKIPAGSSTDKVLRVRGKGLTVKGSAGDMYVRLKVVVPTRLSDDARKTVELFAKATDDADPRADFIRMAKV